ncbi:hypothetical protein H5410_023822 [Solanum commersonii]|uniref:Uncharacterized protein n=1 Tax=Solanum commersonii TaxID=4109 RepID=A0A9J5ZK77_SOLCO|nr:hypothetical protein H5410_023822 [Solanum commersonii]
MAAMSDQITKLTAALAESERKRVAEQQSMSETVQQIKEQVMNLARRPTTSAPDDTVDESDEDDYPFEAASAAVFSGLLRKKILRDEYARDDGVEWTQMGESSCGKGRNENYRPIFDSNFSQTQRTAACTRFQPKSLKIRMTRSRWAAIFRESCGSCCLLTREGEETGYCCCLVHVSCSIRVDVEFLGFFAREKDDLQGSGRCCCCMYRLENLNWE